MRRFLPTLLLCLGADAGCDRLVDDQVEEVVATRSAEAVSAKTNLVLLAEKFAGDPTLAAMTVEEARATAVALLAARLDLPASLDCDLQIVSDPIAGTLDSTVVDCKLGLLRLDGEMHAQVDIELAECEPGACPCNASACPGAVVWTLSEFDLQIGAGLFRPRLRGTVVLRDPVDASLPMTWETGEDFVLENRLGTFATRSNASWTVADDRCVVGMNLEARLDRIEVSEDDPDADLDPEVGTIVVSAQGVDRCPAKCPTAGLVQLAFGRGRLLEWDYDGQRLEVFAPHGRHFTTQLACAE